MSYHKHIFESPLSKHEIKHKSARGGLTVATTQLLTFIARFFSTAILARLLTPNDYGLVAMATVTIGAAAIFKDGGLTLATIQSETIDHLRISKLFWINLAIGFSLTIIVSSVAPYIASFFKNDKLTDVVRLLSIAFTINSLTIQHQALLRRQMKHGRIAVCQIASLTIGLSVAILIAQQRQDYWALVWLHLAASTSSCIITFLILPWKPSLPKKSTNISTLLSFGNDMLVSQMVTYLRRNADNILIGKLSGPTQLGYYEKAYSLLLAPISQLNTPLTTVAIPALSRLKNDPKNYEKFLHNLLSILFLATIPIVTLLFLFSESIVFVWLGPKWEASATLFKLLSLAALAGAISNPHGWVLVSKGLTREYRNLGIFSSIITVGAIFAGSFSGPSGVAIGYSIASSILTFVIWRYTLKHTNTPVSVLISALKHPIIACIPSSIVSYLIFIYLTNTTSILFCLIISSIFFIVIYSSLTFFVFGKYKLLKECASLALTKK
jgi:O-antigen/teichoic acid export membrane protein